MTQTMDAVLVRDRYTTQKKEREKFLGVLISRFSYADETQLRSINDRIVGLGFTSPSFSYDSSLSGHVYTQNDPKFRDVIDSMIEFVCNTIVNIEKTGHSPGDVFRLYEEILQLRDHAEIVTTDRIDNAFRYSFISLMAHFDATVFDLSSIAFCCNFKHTNKLDKERKNRTKINLDEIEQANDLASLRKQVTESVLRPCYLRELTCYLLKHFDLTEPTENSFLQESLFRRNAILHSASVADQKYLSGSDGNPYDELLDGFLQISNQYLDNAEDRCDDFVQKMTLWIIDGAPIRE